MAGLLDDLRARGLVHDHTDEVGLRELLDAGPVTVYCGIDPSADSLHVGHLVGVLVLRRFQEAGHRPLALVGGATGMVGDPSGRSDERSLLDAATLEANVAGIRAQLESLFDFGGDSAARLVNNYDWTRDVTLLEFLRDVGKHVTVNQMVAKDSVRSRMASDQGISFTEFSYMLLQAFDYWWQFEHYDCRLQVGGSDQWGNITAGIDLVRRRSGATVHGLTWPLMTRADGQKFGKTAEGTVWLDAARTLPFELHQYLLNTDDRDTERLLHATHAAAGGRGGRRSCRPMLRRRMSGRPSGRSPMRSAPWCTLPRPPSRPGWRPRFSSGSRSCRQTGWRRCAESCPRPWWRARCSVSTSRWSTL